MSEISERYGKPATHAEICRYLHELLDVSFKEETLKTQRTSLDIQKGVERTQYIIAFAMFLTVIITSHFNLQSHNVQLQSYDTQLQSYNAQLELNSPLFEVNLHCSPMSNENGTILMESKVTNHGKVGAHINGTGLLDGDLEVGYSEVDGVPQKFTGKKRTFTYNFIEGGGQKEWNVTMNTKNATNDFRVIFSFNCKSIDEKYSCKFVTNNVSCDYHFNGTHYLHQQCCVR